MTRQAKVFAALCAIVLATYLAVALKLPEGYSLSRFADLAQAGVLAAAVLSIARHLFTTRGRERTFWAMVSAGALLWFLADFEWVWYEVIRHKDVPDPSLGDVALFIHVVPFMAALALRTHARRGERLLRFDTLDFSLLLLWWVYLYSFVIIPWQFTVSSEYQRTYYNTLYLIENLVLVLGAFALALRSHGEWRKIYSWIFLSASIYTFSSYLINQKIVSDIYYSGSVYDIPLVASMCALCGLGVLARTPVAEAAEAEDSLESPWAQRLAMLALISMPALALLKSALGGAPLAVAVFRLRITLAAMLLMSLLVLYKQRLLFAELRRLLRHAQESFDNLQRMQDHLVNSEKLAALGHLVAGAAHEINNPLTAILGYSELLASDSKLGEQPRSLADKIGHQARRTKRLVANMLSFAQQQPASKAPVQINALLNNVLQLREPDLAGKRIRINSSLDLDLPEVWGDSNHLLQVFLHITNNAVDALQEVGGGLITITTRLEGDWVLAEFRDTGPGIKDASRIFDPFFTTKPVGKGTGLGLSVCYGLIHDHGGEIECRNNAEGGASFVVKLPVIKKPAEAVAAV